MSITKGFALHTWQRNLHTSYLSARAAKCKAVSPYLKIVSQSNKEVDFYIILKVDRAISFSNNIL